MWSRVRVHAGKPRPCLVAKPKSVEQDEHEPDELAVPRVRPALPSPGHDWRSRFTPRPAPRRCAPRWTDCGDPECKRGCAPRIAKAAQRRHERVVASTLPLVRTWIGDLYGTGEERTASEERPYARPSRAAAPEPAYVTRALSPDECATVVRWLDEQPLRRSYLDEDGGRAEWSGAVYLELVQPSALVARRDADLTLRECFDRAVNRAQASMATAARGGLAYTLTTDYGRTPTRGSGDE